MDYAAIIYTIKAVSFFIGLLGIIFSSDALFLGGRLAIALDNFLSRSIDLDRMVIGNPRLRRLLGSVFLVISLLMIILVKV